MSAFWHYLHAIAPQVHSFSEAMVALSFVMFCLTGLVGWAHSLCTGKRAEAWKFFFSGIVFFGAIWALIPARF